MAYLCPLSLCVRRICDTDTLRDIDDDDNDDHDDIDRFFVCVLDGRARAAYAGAVSRVTTTAGILERVSVLRTSAGHALFRDLT